MARWRIRDLPYTVIGFVGFFWLGWRLSHWDRDVRPLRGQSLKARPNGTENAQIPARPTDET